ncbi:MFS transporter [Isoptericola haloaureus]|uniref:MFS transporter n=1 Tax=Isoptericola haloaureus TaxID=1542902 RepID=A0ABU7Z3I7_9MICO
MQSSNAPAPDVDTTGPLDPASLAPDTGLPAGRGRILRFGSGFLLNGVLWAVGLAIVSTVLLPQRLRDVGYDAETAAALFGTINAVAAVVSLVANLVFGNLSDRTRLPMGRRAPWIAGGAVLGGVSLALTGFLNSAVTITLVYAVAMVGLNMMLAPALAVLADRVPPKARGTMSAFYGTGVAVGYPLGSLVGAAFISSTTPGFLVGGVLLLAGGVAALALWPREVSAATLPPAAGGLRDLVRSFRPPRNAPDFYWAFAGRLFMLLSYQMIFAFQLYIAQDYLGQTTEQSAATIAVTSVIVLVVSLLGSAAGGPISDLLRRRKLPVVLSSVLFAVGIAMPWLLPTTTGLYLFAGIAGFGYGVYTSVDQALNVDVLPDPETAGKDLGILNLSTTLGQTAGPLVTGWLVAGFGGYGAAFPVSIAAALLGAFAITRIRAVR